MYITPIHRIYHTNKNGVVSLISRVKKLEIKSNIRDLPVTTATLVMPLRSTDIRDKYITKQDIIDDNYDKVFAKGDKIEIYLGYKEFNLEREFIGYVDMMRIKDEVITLELEDDANYLKYFWPDNFEFIEPTKNNKLKHPTLLDIVGKIIKNSPITLADTEYTRQIKEWVYSSYRFLGKRTALDLLRELMSQTGLLMRVDKDRKLHVQLPFIESMGAAMYSTQRNVIDTTLKYGNDRTILHYYEVVDKDGKVISRSKLETGTGRPVLVDPSDKFDYGKKAYKVTVLNVPSIKKKTADVIAKSANLRETNSGYEGSFKTWGRPMCKVGYYVGLFDDGTKQVYWIDKVTTHFNGKDGFIRIIHIGKRVV